MRKEERAREYKEKDRKNRTRSCTAIAEYAVCEDGGQHREVALQKRKDLTNSKLILERTKLSES